MPPPPPRLAAQRLRRLCSPCTRRSPFLRLVFYVLPSLTDAPSNLLLIFSGQPEPERNAGFGGEGSETRGAGSDQRVEEP